MTNSNGSKTKSYAYNAFGVEYNESTLDDNPFRYCGEYYDKETQTIYLRARYYDSTTGRFTQEDPIRDGYNWYSYCNNNPVIFADPMGKDAIYVCRTEYFEDHGLPIVGHGSILIQDDEGNWYHTEYGGKSKSTAMVKLEKLDASVEEYLAQWDYEISYYIEGDFSKAYEYAVWVTENYSDYGGYDLLSNNCLHYVKNVMSHGTFDNYFLGLYVKNSICIIPSSFYNDIVRMDFFVGNNRVFINNEGPIKSWVIEWFLNR